MKSELDLHHLNQAKIFGGENTLGKESSICKGSVALKDKKYWRMVRHTMQKQASMKVDGEGKQVKKHFWQEVLLWKYYKIK